jgi:hypothetical protein
MKLIQHLLLACFVSSNPAFILSFYHQKLFDFLVSHLQLPTVPTQGESSAVVVLPANVSKAITSGSGGRRPSLSLFCDAAFLNEYTE